MASNLLFIKVHNGFPEHPKTGHLSDRAFRNLIELWCYCSRNLTDGHVQNAQANRILSRKSRTELIAAGFVVEHATGVEMHDYLEHQQSAQQVADLRQRRAEAGSRGGKSKANHLANAKQSAKQTPSKPVADTDTDTDTDREGTSPSLRATALEVPDRFDEFWDAYDKKDGRKLCVTAYRAALKKPGVTADLLIAAALSYVDWQRSEGKHPTYTKNPLTWLRGEHWTDERAARVAPLTRVQQGLALVNQLAAEEATTLPRQIGDGS